MTETCHGVTHADDDDSKPTLLPPCLDCQRRADARTSDNVLWVSPPVTVIQGRWHCPQRLAPAAAAPAQGQSA